MRLQAFAATPEQFAPLIEELRFRYHKWDAYVGGVLRVFPGALVLTRAEHEDAVDCCVRLHGAFARAGAALSREPAWMDRLGIPRAVQEIIRAERPHNHGIVRYDLIPTASGWMTPEVNEDAPGGFNECIASRPLFGSLLEGSVLEATLHSISWIPCPKDAGWDWCTPRVMPKTSSMCLSWRSCCGRVAWNRCWPLRRT